MLGLRCLLYLHAYAKTVRITNVESTPQQGETNTHTKGKAGKDLWCSRHGQGASFDPTVPRNCLGGIAVKHPRIRYQRPRRTRCCLLCGFTHTSSIHTYTTFTDRIL